ncbi:lipid-A-disaccharide synthase N-terminal domain-containing protein [Dyella sp. A6]|uniref:lipid-A-disaccharide synthase N-terminal domain-containing protein n=1 Tax=Dyella aluminiiresistens TaxID=3069105 RepID=UPI002E77E63A|nr:lipid-A-disaccharide synthase N-terminal domain-containing protein [Dyella sp. A6]
MTDMLSQAMLALQSHGWLLLGAIGQAVFSSRFVLQWVYSERRGQSAIPMLFWYVSIIGAALLLGYAIHLRDPVFITAQSGGMLIYLRNLQLRRREARETAAEGSSC